MSEQTKKAPVIRFKGFFDDWEQRKLGDDKDVRDGTHDSPKYHKEGHPLVTSKNLNDYGLDMTDVSLISDADFEAINKRSKVDNGDILFGMIGTIGNPVIVDRSDFAIKNVALIKEGGDIPNRFLIQLLKSSVFEKYIRNENAGNTQKFLGLSKIREFIFFAPTTEEQIKIATFFKQLDDTIALHLCKQRKLNQLKQSLMREILPQSDSFSPHLRLANFRDPWEKHQLKEVLKVNSGRDCKHLDKGNIPVYGTGGYMLSVDGKLSDIDGIGLGRKGTIDKPQYLKAPFWTVDTLFYLTPFPKYDIYFLYTLIQSINWKSMDESTGVPSLSKSVIERVTLTFPVLEEQQKIGSVFKQLDDTLILHQKKIAHLKTLKCTLLNKMFI